MFLLGNLFQAMATILELVLRLYSLVVIIAVLISWVGADPYNPLVQFLRSVTEPVLAWIRRRVPFAMMGMVDLSPLLLLLVIQLCQMVLVRSLFDLSIRLH